MNNHALAKLLLVLSVVCSGLASFIRFDSHMGIPAVGFGVLSLISYNLGEDHPKQKWVFVTATLLAIFAGLMNCKAF